MSNKDVLMTLTSARNLISDPKCWTKNAFARRKSGHKVTAYSNSAVKWCAVGAILRGEVESSVSDALNYMADVIDGSILVLNDDKYTKHEDILNAFDRAIARLESEA